MSNARIQVLAGGRPVTACGVASEEDAAMAQDRRWRRGSREAIAPAHMPYPYRNGGACGDDIPEFLHRRCVARAGARIRDKASEAVTTQREELSEAAAA